MNAKAIFHIDEMHKWPLVLNNVKNLLSSYGNDSDAVLIEVLANSEAVKGYVADDHAALQPKLEALHQQGVVFAACNNALTGFGIERGQLFPFVTIVPAGVRELVDRQAEGCAYIKP